jgi:PAS domain S-box-containing protein
MSKPEPTFELEELRAQLLEARQTLNAISSGEVDALVVSGSDGEQIYTLHGADFSSRVLLQEMSEGALTLLPDGTVLYCNARFAAMVKLPHERIIGMPIEQFVASADQESFRVFIHQARDGGGKQELTLCVADGSAVPTYCSVSPVRLDDQPCLCMVVTDLTEQKRNEEVIASGTLARSILEQAGDIIVVCDGAGTIIEASRATHEYCERNVLHEPFDKVFPISTGNGTPLGCGRDIRDIKDGGSSHLNDCLGGKKVQGVEVQWHCENGAKHDLLMSARPLHDFAGRVLGCVFTFSDISEIKRGEEALRQSEEKFRRLAEELEQQLIASGRLVSLGEITASMAHEFNNPLGIIMGFVEDMLSNADPAHPEYQALQIIDEESKRCQKIIQDLMEFARPVNTTPCLMDIGGLIGKTLQLIDARLYKQKVALTKAIAPDLPQIHVDPKQLEQVLVNLYLNALDAMLGGGNLMVAVAFETGNPEPMIMITIADTGMGIDANDLQKIFQPFFTARKKAGLGLGLSICERIVKNHGGRIEVESQVDQGTIFRILLPVNPPSK